VSVTDCMHVRMRMHLEIHIDLSVLQIGTGSIACCACNPVNFEEQNTKRYSYLSFLFNLCIHCYFRQGALCQ